eukprot:2353090-Prymnesium_polylepis.1
MSIAHTKFERKSQSFRDVAHARNVRFRSLERCRRGRTCGAVGAACLQSKVSHLPRGAAPAASPARLPLPVFTPPVHAAGSCR